MISSLIPNNLKVKIKSQLLQKLHAKPEITSRIANRIVREGMPNYLNWSFESEKEVTLRYVESLRTGDYEYKFSRTALQPTLYGSIYVCMLLGIYGELDKKSAIFKKGWLDYFDSFQDPVDGLFRDPLLAGPAFEGSHSWGDGWGIRHLLGHIIIAYARLGEQPKYPFKFLEPYYSQSYMNDWLKRFDFSGNVWSQSNYIMNLYTALQYARDFMNEKRASVPIEIITKWLLSHQREDTGMWHDYEISGYPEVGDAIRGAYHFYPLFVFEGQDIQYPERIIDVILSSQNTWGGFNPDEMASGACEDIDALDPLLRASCQTDYRKDEVERALQKAMVWILSCRSRGGGYESIPEHGCHYGGHPLTTSLPGEGNLFATWFRTLCLSYLVDHLCFPHAFFLGTYPGYEIAL